MWILRFFYHYIFREEIKIWIKTIIKLWKLSKLSNKKLFCNWTVILKDKKKKSGKCFQTLTSLGLHIFIYYLKWKLKNNKKEKKIDKIKEYFSFELIGKIFQLQIRTFLCWILWHINHCKLFNAKSSSFTSLFPVSISLTDGHKILLVHGLGTSTNIHIYVYIKRESRGEKRTEIDVLFL